MKLLELHINGFGKIHDRTISFSDGINVIYGRNEAGKSTLHTFIRGMLFGMERGRGRAARNDLYSKYEPWENSGTYEGWLRLEQGGVVYRIERRFRKDDRYLRIINETQGREEEPTRALMDRILGGLNETTYNNTISISQLKSATEDGMVGELKNYIANMNTTGNISLNITKATAFLKNQKRSLEANLVPDASREYTALLAEIRAVDAEISSPQYENQLAVYQRTRSQVKGIIENTQAERAALAEKVKKSRQVLADGQFADRSSVAACEEKARSLYDSFCTAERECKKRSRKLLAGAGMLLAVCGALLAGYLGITDLSRFLPFVIAGGGGAIMGLVLAMVLTARGKRFDRKMEEARAQLSELLARHLGDGTVSSEAMDAFYGRMAEFSKLCDMLDQSEHALDKYTEDISSLQEKQNNCSEMIEKQQRTQWELEKKLDSLNEDDILILAGSIPASLSQDTYERLLARLQGRGVRAVVDATRDLLVNVLQYHPFLIKPNNHELGEIVGRVLTTDEEIIAAARTLQQKGAHNVLVSMAGDGALLMDENGEVHRIGCPKGKVVNSVGAGDSMVAGFVAGWMQTRSYSFALRLGTACGSATAFSLGLATKEKIDELMKEI